MSDPGPFGLLEGFGQDARRMLAAAAVEAEGLGHDRIGTEHILLGLLSDDEAPASQALRDAGVSLAAARHKVDEAVGVSAGGARTKGALTTTKRATRAVEGALRTSHQRRSEAVSSGDLLVAVLNVEGTAGQVLRGLGVDIERLRAAAEHGAPHGTVLGSSDSEDVLLRCPSCGDEIGARIRHQVVAAQVDAGTPRNALVFSCGSCGVVLGIGPA